MPPRALCATQREQVAVALFPLTVLCVSVSLHAKASAQLSMPPWARLGAKSLLVLTLLCVSVSVPSFSRPPTVKKLPPALLPLTMLCVSVRVPKFRTPPTGKKVAPLPWPLVIVRPLTLTVSPASTVTTVPTPCPSNVAPPLPASVRLCAISNEPVQVPVIASVVPSVRLGLASAVASAVESATQLTATVASAPAAPTPSRARLTTAINATTADTRGRAERFQIRRMIPHLRRCAPLRGRIAKGAKNEGEGAGPPSSSAAAPARSARDKYAPLSRLAQGWPGEMVSDT